MLLKTQISIIGCGWLGMSLATNLIDEGYIIKGSTTSKEKLAILKNKSIIPYEISLSSAGINGDIINFLNGSDTLIINIPSGLRKQPHKNHVSEIEFLLKAVQTSTIKQVIYVSSTSVFENNTDMPIFELEDHPKVDINSTDQLLKIEQLLKAQTQFKTTIVRFGGLFGEDRHPGKNLSGRTNIKNPEAPINLIHKNDCIAIISKIITSNLWNKTLNLAYPFHPTKRDYYTNYCKLYNIATPKFNTKTASKGKYIDSANISTILDISFSYKP